MKICNFQSPRRFATLIASVIFTMAALSQTILGQTTWSGTGANWSSATWSAGVPNSATAANLTGTGTFNINTAAAAASVALANASGTLTLNINDGQSLSVTGAITDTGAGTANILINNTTSANAATVLTATSIAVGTISVGNPTTSATFFSFGNDITAGVQFALGSAGGATAGSTTFTQTAGTVTATNSNFGVSIGQALSVPNPTGTHTYNLNGGTIIAARIGVLNANGNNNNVDRYAMDGTLNFNEGTIQSTLNGTLNIQNGYAFGAYNGSGTKDMQFDTSKPLNVVLAPTGTHTFNAVGASGDIRVSPSAQITGCGTLTKTGLGNLTFTGGGPVALSNWSGDTTVTEGNIVSNYSVIAGQAATGGQDVLADAFSASSRLVLNGGNYTMTGRSSAAATSLSGVTLSAGVFTATVSSTTGLVVGQSVTNGFLPSGTYIRRIISATQIELSAMSTSTAVQSSQTLDFGAASFANSQVINDVTLASSATITVTPGSGSSTTLLSFGNVTGSGALTKQGAGTLSLTGSLTYNGSTAVSAGTIDFAPVSGTSTLIGNITGAGNITKSGSGTTIIAGGANGNTISGTLAVNGGTLQIGNSTTNNDSTQRLVSISSVTVASGATLVLNNSGALRNGNAPIILAGNLTGDTTGIAVGGFHNALGALTMNAGTLTTYNGASLGFQAYALNGDVSVGGSSASYISAGGTSGNNGVHLANNAAGVTRIFDVADVTSSSDADLIVSARLLNSSNAGAATALTKNGAGTLVLSGSNSYTGTTTISVGTLQLGDGGTTGSLDSASAIVNNATLAFNRSNTITQGTDFATVISGTGALIQAGSGNLIFTGANTYTGGTVFNAGTIQIDNANALNSTGNLTFEGGALRYGSGITEDFSSRFKNSGSAIVIDTNGENIAFASVIDSSNSGGLTKNGAGDLTISGSNTFTGDVTLNAGRLILGNDSALDGASGSIVINSGTLDVTAARTLSGNKAQHWNGNFTFAGSNTLNMGTGAVTLGANSTVTVSASTLTVGGDMSGTGYALGKSGAGTLVLSGSNSYTGATTVNSGTVLFDGVNALSSSSSVLDAGTATLSFLDGATNNITSSGGLTLNNSTFVFDLSESSADRLNFGGSASLSGTNTININFLNSANAGNFTLLTAAGGLNSSWSLDPSVLQSGFTFTLDQSSATQLVLVVASSTSGRYWTGEASNNWSGVNFSTSSNGSATFSGAGLDADSDLIFAGDTPTNLATVISSNYTIGSLAVSTAGVSINGSHTITANKTGDATYSVTAGSGTTNIGATLAGAGAGLTMAGGGTLALNAANSYGGNTTVTSGTLAINNASAISNGTLVITGGSLNNTSGGAITLSTNNAQSWNGDFAFAGTNDLNLGTGAVTLGGTRVVTVTAGNLTVGGNIGASAFGLTKEGVGTLVLSGSNAYTGTTTINAGTLRISGGNAISDSGVVTLADASGVTFQVNSSETIASLQGGGSTGGVVAVASGQTLTVAESGSQTFSGVISGAGALTLNGSGTMSLAGANTYTGGTTISAGTLVLGNTTAAGSGDMTQSNSSSLLKIDATGTITNNMSVYNVLATQSATLSGAITVNNATWDIETGRTLTISGAVSGPGGVTKNGTGTLSLTGSLTYNGSTAVSAGTIDFAPVSGTSTLIGNITGAGNITKSGSGTTIIAGGANGNTISGTLAVNGGTLQIGNSTTSNDSTQRLVSISSVTVASGATLVLNNSGALRNGNAPIILAGNLTGDTTGIAVGGFHNALGALTMNAGTLTTYNGASLGFQAYALNGDVSVGGSSASYISAGGTSGNNGVHLANNAAGVTRIFDVADVTSSSDADLIVSARLLNSSNAGAATALTKNGAGTLVLSGNNSYTGTTTINAGTLQANASGALGSTTNIKVNGGSLLVTAADAIGNSTGIDLAGGTLEFSGNINETVGALTLSADSVIDLGTGSVVAIFADLFMGNYTLAVHNWTGTTQWNGGTGNNADQVYFNRNLSGGELGRISFYSDFGSGFLGTGFQLGLGSGFQYEVIPVPETETWVAAAVLLAGAGVAWMKRRRRRRGNMDEQDFRGGEATWGA